MGAKRKRAKRPKKKPAKMGRPLKLTKKLAKAITADIKAGAFVGVAAMRQGITRMTLHRWRIRGEEALQLEAEGKAVPQAEQLYADFCYVLEQAGAEARYKAEVAVFDGSADDNKRFWLTRGPGKTRRHRPGWSEGRETDVDRETGAPPDEARDELMAELRRVEKTLVSQAAKKVRARAKSRAKR